MFTLFSQEDVDEAIRQEIRQEARQEIRQEVRQVVRQEVRQVVRQEVRQEGIKIMIKCYQEDGFSPEAVELRLVKFYGLTKNEAVEIIQKYW